MTAFPSLVSPFGMRRILRVNVRQTMRGDLVVEREWRNRRVQHCYEIPWSVLTAANKTTLLSFFSGCQGRYLDDIAYLDPWDGDTYTCRLDQDVLSLSLVNPHWTGTLRLVEIADWQLLGAVVPTFPVTVPFQPGVTANLTHRTVIGTQEDGSELFYPDFDSGIMSWGVGGETLTDAQATDLLACWSGNGGPYHSFSFTDITTTPPTVYSSCHFVETEITHTLVTLNEGGFVHSLRMTVEELK